MSLRLRILLLVLVATLLPVLMMLWVLLQQRASTFENEHRQLQLRADAVAKDLDDKIAGTGQLLFGLGRVLLSNRDQAACSEFLGGVLREHPQYTGILTIRPDGNLHCDSLQLRRQLQLRDRQYFQQALQSDSMVVEPAVGRLTGKAVLQIAYPVRDAQHKLQFVLLASLDLNVYIDQVLHQQPYAHTSFHLWNRDGSFALALPAAYQEIVPPPAMLQSYMLAPTVPASAQLENSASAWAIARAALPRSRQADLRLSLTVPLKDLQAQAQAQFKKAMLGLIASMAFVLVFAGLIAEVALRRHTARIMRAISRMDTGRYDQPLGPPYPRGELGQVMIALDRMANSLQRQKQEITIHTQALERQARIDPLTHLANRHMLLERLSLAMAQAQRNARVTGVLILDLDRFKTVNDSLGHAQGDLLLQEVASRLSAVIREGDTVARLGGDEFVVVLSDMGSADDIELVAKKIITALAHPMQLGPQMLSITTSLGIALYPRDADSATALLQYADTAMYRAKEAGGNACAFFSPDMRQTMLARLDIEAGLRRALEHGELRLVYQPLIDAQSGKIVSTEALLRWRSPARGEVPPVEFIPLAEETGLIVPIGNWVLNEACRQARAWQEAGLEGLAIAVNLSVRQFSAPGLEGVVAEALQRAQCPAELLHLEITESSIAAPMTQVEQTLAALSAIGVHVSIDDFGTGYSSLSRLKRLPVSTLKIDRSFVRDIEHDSSDQVLVEAIIELAHKLGLQTVAEGVETESQRAFLHARGCDLYQGYLFSRPCDAEAIPGLAREFALRASSAAPKN